MICDDTFDDTHALATLRKESLDIYNRLHSIEEDIAFVNHIQSHYSNFPLLRECVFQKFDPNIPADGVWM
jgi:tRNA A64-2'-O-ribosylphosphate transferase